MKRIFLFIIKTEKEVYLDYIPLFSLNNNYLFGIYICQLPAIDGVCSVA